MVKIGKIFTINSTDIYMQDDGLLATRLFLLTVHEYSDQKCIFFQNIFFLYYYDLGIECKKVKSTCRILKGSSILTRIMGTSCQEFVLRVRFPLVTVDPSTLSML